MGTTARSGRRLQTKGHPAIQNYSRPTSTSSSVPFSNPASRLRSAAIQAFAFHSRTPLQMADDASYSAFLDRANQSTSATTSTPTQSTSQARSRYDPTLTKTNSDPSAIPQSLQGIKHDNPPRSSHQPYRFIPILTQSSTTSPTLSFYFPHLSTCRAHTLFPRALVLSVSLPITTTINLIQVMFKPVAYGIKLKLEYAILGKLVTVARGGYTSEELPSSAREINSYPSSDPSNLESRRNMPRQYSPPWFWEDTHQS